MPVIPDLRRILRLRPVQPSVPGQLDQLGKILSQALKEKRGAEDVGQWCCVWPPCKNPWVQFPRPSKVIKLNSTLVLGVLKFQ